MTLAEQYPLPDIKSSALVRAVFTHKSMAGRPAGLVHVDEPGDDNESLAFLGDTVISLVVSAVLCSNLPLSRPGDLTDKRKLLVNQDRLASWADAYDLPSHLRAHQSAEILLRHNTGTKAKLFQAYIGALFLQTDRNYRAVEDWFGQLVEQGLEDIKSFENAAEILTERLQSLKMNEPAEDQPPPAQVPSSSPSPSGSSSGSSRAPAQVPPSSPSPSNSSRSSSSNASYPTQLGRLALFNQLCSQKHIRPDWQCSSLGASHRPSHRATVRLSPTSDIIGTGVAGKKKEAQEKAAEEAMEKLGWVEL